MSEEEENPREETETQGATPQGRPKVNVTVHVQGIAEPVTMNVGSTREIIENLEVPDQYEIKLIRGEEILTDEAELQEGDEISAQPVLKGM